MATTAFSLDTVFRATAARQPERAAILGPQVGVELSYGALDRAIAAAAAALAAAGVEPRATVGLHGPSGRDYIVWTYALWRLGACVVPVPIELADAEKRQILQTIKVDAVLSAGAGAGAVFAAPFGQADAIGVHLPDMGGVAATLRMVRSPRAHPPGFAAVNAAFIRFTSGTTGRSKGVVLSHETIDARIKAANAALRIGPQDCVLWLLSMSYHFAVSIAGYLSVGAGIALPRNHLAPEVLGAAQRHGATVLYASPTHYAWMAGMARTAATVETVDAAAAPAPGEGTPPGRLRLAVSTTAALDGGVGRLFQRRFGLPVVQALGLIEVGLPFINVDFAGDRCEGVGRPLPAYRLRLADAGFGPHCREILVAGPGCLDAYYDPWQPRAEVMADGWFHTGDVGEVDADGCLFLRGRAKDVINVMGMKVFPHEVEAVLASHPEVAEACVRSTVDERLGEVPAAQVVLKRRGAAAGSRDSLLDFCRRRLAGYKVPLTIEVVDALSKTASGKLLHRPTPVTG